MAQYYADSDSNGNIVGFYYDELHETIPKTAIAITNEQWADSVANPGKYMVQGGQFVLTPPPSAAQQLTTAIQSKISTLLQSRNDAINGGFTSQTTGHEYFFDDESQKKMQGKVALLAASPGITSVGWLTKNAGFVTHTRDQFIGVATDADAFETAQHMKYYTKEAQVQACTTMDQINTIGWPVNPNPPATPAGLAIKVAGAGGITVTWTANTDVTMIGGGFYNVYLTDVTAAGQPVVTKATAAASTVTGLVTGHNYSVQVTAVDTDGLESAKSAAVSITVD